MENYNVDYFIKKFEAIPEEKWITWKFAKFIGLFSLGSCAQGFCWPLRLRLMAALEKSYYVSTKDYPEWNALINLPFGGDVNEENWSRVGTINNGNDERYQQPTPKQRILAALYDIKKAQQPEVKERIVYVTVDQPVRELQKSVLSLS